MYILGMADFVEKLLNIYCFAVWGVIIMIKCKLNCVFCDLLKVR